MTFVGVSEESTVLVCFEKSAITLQSWASVGGKTGICPLEIRTKSQKFLGKPEVSS